MSVQNIGRHKWRVGAKGAPDPKTGKSKYRSIRITGSKADAYAALAKMGGTLSAGGGQRLGDYLYETWLPTLNVSAGMAAEYRRGAAMLAALYDISLERLAALHIEKAIHSLPPGSRRQKAKKTLSAALNAAVRWDIITTNPLAKALITVGEGDSRKYDAYDAAELSRLLGIVRGHAGEAAVILMAYCGLRKEEALGLDWEDIDLESGTVEVTRSWTRRGRHASVGKTKTPGSTRSVYIDGGGLARLREIGTGRTGPLWPGAKSARIAPEAATKSFRNLVERTDLRYAPIGHLRHSHATISLAHGVDVVVVSKSLGHSRPSTTVNAYIRPLESARRAAAKGFADAIGG